MFGSASQVKGLGSSLASAASATYGGLKTYDHIR
jgi:hypothetical protein